MPLEPAAFSHHPELAGRIGDPATSFFRDLRVEKLIEQNPDLEPLRGWFHTDAERDASRRPILERNGDGDLWIFAYGSLMWDPALDFAEVRRVRVEGYSRQFSLLDTKGARGTPEAPGLMAALDHGGTCEGLAFRIEASKVDTETEILWRREMIGPGYIPTFVTGMLGERPQALVTFVGDHASPDICPGLTEEETVRFIATGAGILGTSRDYLGNIVGHFDTLGISDAYCSGLLRAVDAYLAEARR